jgi:hypothetical protein
MSECALSSPLPCMSSYTKAADGGADGITRDATSATTNADPQPRIGALLCEGSLHVKQGLGARGRGLEGASADAGSLPISKDNPPQRRRKVEGSGNGHDWARPIFRPHATGAGDRGLGTGGVDSRYRPALLSEGNRRLCMTYIKRRTSAQAASVTRWSATWSLAPTRPLSFNQSVPGVSRLGA